jgi:hypothetical protein
LPPPYIGLEQVSLTKESNMANITRLDPLDDLFRGFFVRPVDINGSLQQGKRPANSSVN